VQAAGWENLTFPGWVSINLTDCDYFVDGDFTIALEYEIEDRPKLGSDYRQPNGRILYITNLGTWNYMSTLSSNKTWDDLDLMIRAFVIPLPNVDPVANANAPYSGYVDEVIYFILLDPTILMGR